MKNTNQKAQKITSPGERTETDAQTYFLLFLSSQREETYLTGPEQYQRVQVKVAYAVFLSGVFGSKGRAAYQFPQENRQCDDKKNGDALHDGPDPGRKTEFCNFDEAVKQEPEGKCASVYLQGNLSHYSTFIWVTGVITVMSEHCSQ
ncbi:hypothetical protein HEN96_023835 [Escherichia coli]|nr:hypothetical protein [Escherichia coli]